MPTPEELQAELTASKEANEKLIADAAAAKANNPADALNAKISVLEKQAADITAESTKMKINIAKQEAVKEYPLAAGFYEQLHGDNAEKIKENAKIFHENVAKSNEVAIKAKEDEHVAQWGQIPSGGMPGILRQEDLDAKMEEAKKEPDTLRKIGKMMGVKMNQIAMGIRGQK